MKLSPKCPLLNGKITDAWLKFSGRIQHRLKLICTKNGWISEKIVNFIPYLRPVFMMLCLDRFFSFYTHQFWGDPMFLQAPIQRGGLGWGDHGTLSFLTLSFSLVYNNIFQILPSTKERNLKLYGSQLTLTVRGHFSFFFRYKITYNVLNFSSFPEHWSSLIIQQTISNNNIISFFFSFFFSILPFCTSLFSIACLHLHLIFYICDPISLVIWF